MTQISVFAGTAKAGRNRGMYALSIYCGGEVLTMPSQMVSSGFGKLTDSVLILTSLRRALQDISSVAGEAVAVDFYGNHNGIMSVWETYLDSGIITAEGTAERKLWREITTFVKEKEITLCIKGKDTLLQKLSNEENARARRSLNRQRET